MPGLRPYGLLCFAYRIVVPFVGVGDARIVGHARGAARHGGITMSNTPVAENDLPVDEDGKSDEEASWFERLLATFPQCTAIIACNDDMAAAAVSVAHRRGLDVPRDLSVVGFDDTPTATTVWPELTTIRQPIAAMAASSVELLLRSIRRRKDGEARVVVDHVVAHILVKRDSVAPCVSS